MTVHHLRYIPSMNSSITTFDVSFDFERELQSQSPNGTGSSDHGMLTTNDPYEFVAFLLWYGFLILCCLVPTCFAYRRRRSLERRVREHQLTNLAQFQQAATLMFLNANSNQLGSFADEAMQEQRSGLLLEALKATTMTISSGDLRTLDDSIEFGRSNSMKNVPTTTSEIQDAKIKSDTNDTMMEMDPEIAMSSTNDTVPTKGTGVTTVDDEELDWGMESNTVLRLPALTPTPTIDSTTGMDGKSSSSTNKATSDVLPAFHRMGCVREVGGTCAICLSPYVVGDKVTWAADNAHEGLPSSSSSSSSPVAVGAEQRSSTTMTTTPNSSNINANSSLSEHDTINCCPHAFHTDCIIGWLSKQENPKCPVCRQPFCKPVMVVPPPESNIPSPTNGLFNFSGTVAETVALARIFIAAQQLEQQVEQQQQQQQQQAASVAAASSLSTSLPPTSHQSLGSGNSNHSGHRELTTATSRNATP